MKRRTKPRYNGFISYSHAADGKLAPTVQNALHSLAKPWYRLRALHVFRDETSLSANPALWPSIEKALSLSQWFIYLASPLAAESLWVKREISWWLLHREPSTLLVVLTEGSLKWDNERGDFDWSITNAIPHELAEKFTSEPLWVDLSWAKNTENLSLRHSQFHSAILRLAAPMHGRPPDELDGEDVRQHRRNQRIVYSVAATLVFLTVTAVATSYFAVKNSRESASRELATYSIQQLDTDPELSLRLALHAVEKAKTLQAEDALRTALVESKVRITIPTSGQVNGARFSPNTATVGLASHHEVVLITTKTGETRILEHPALVWSINFSSDGNQIWTASWDGKARMWDVASGQMLLEIDTQDDQVEFLRLNSDSSLVLTVSVDRKDISTSKIARVWDVKSGKLVAELKGHTAPIQDAQFDPTGTRIVTGGWDSAIRIWDAKSGTVLKTLEGHSASVVAVAFNATGDRIVSGSLDLTVRYWDAATGEVSAVSGQKTDMERISEITERIVVLSPGAERALVYGAGKAAVYNTGTGEKISELANVPSSVPYAVFSNDGQKVVVPSRSGIAYVWDVKTGNQISEFRGHKGDLNGAAFSPDGHLLITSGTDNSARIWLIEKDTLEKTTREFVFRGHQRAVVDAIWSSDGRLVATGGKDETARIWDTQTGAALSVLPATGRVSSLAFSQDSKRLLVARYDAGGAHTWDVETGKLIQEFVGRQTDFEILEGADWISDESIIFADVGGALFRWNSTNGEQLDVISSGKNSSVLDGLCGYSQSTDLACIKSEDQTLVQIWDVATGTMISEIKGHVTPAMLTAMSADGDLLALSDQYRVEIWEVHTGRLKCRLEQDQEFINRLSFSPNGTRIVTGGGESEPVGRIWDTSSGKLITELRGHKHSIQSARFSPDERLVVTASQDNTARIWSAEDGRVIATLRGHDGMIFEARFSPDGRRVLTAGNDATARIYDASLAKPLSELIRIARGRFPRELTPEEAGQYLH